MRAPRPRDLLDDGGVPTPRETKPARRTKPSLARERQIKSPRTNPARRPLSPQVAARTLLTPIPPRLPPPQVKKLDNIIHALDGDGARRTTASRASIKTRESLITDPNSKAHLRVGKLKPSRRRGGAAGSPPPRIRAPAASRGPTPEEDHFSDGSGDTSADAGSGGAAGVPARRPRARAPVAKPRPSAAGVGDLLEAAASLSDGEPPRDAHEGGPGRPPRAFAEDERPAQRHLLRRGDGRGKRAPRRGGGAPGAQHARRRRRRVRHGRRVPARGSRRRVPCPCPPRTRSRRPGRRCPRRLRRRRRIPWRAHRSGDARGGGGGANAGRRRRLAPQAPPPPPPPAAAPWNAAAAGADESKRAPGVDDRRGRRRARSRTRSLRRPAPSPIGKPRRRCSSSRGCSGARRRTRGTPPRRGRRVRAPAVVTRIRDDAVLRFFFVSRRGLLSPRESVPARNHHNTRCITRGRRRRGEDGCHPRASTPTRFTPVTRGCDPRGSIRFDPRRAEVPRPPRGLARLKYQRPRKLIRQTPLEPIGSFFNPAMRKY